jgi:hypothetical protein
LFQWIVLVLVAAVAVGNLIGDIRERRETPAHLVEPLWSVPHWTAAEYAETCRSWRAYQELNREAARLGLGRPFACAISVGDYLRTLGILTARAHSRIDAVEERGVITIER